MSGQPSTSRLDKESEIDVEWERFAQGGCPDWWLMAKYTSGWLTKGLPYVAFKDRVAGTTWRTQSSPEAALHRAADAPGAAQPAANPPTRSQSLDTPLVATTPPQAASAARHHPSAAAAGVAPLTAQATATPSPPAADQVQPSAASSSPLPTGHTPGCAPLKGLFGCQCTAVGQVDKSLDQAAS